MSIPPQEAKPRSAQLPKKIAEQTLPEVEQPKAKKKAE